MNHKIRNVGCDDETEGVFKFTEEQFEFLKVVFDELNKYSRYGCMPRIYIDETTDEPTEPPQKDDSQITKSREVSYSMGNRCEVCGRIVPDGDRMCTMCAFSKSIDESYKKDWEEHLNQPSSLFLKLKPKKGGTE